MKVLRLLLTVFILGSIYSCKVGNVSKSGGMENQSYLQFVQGSSQSYKDGVTVYVDNDAEFTANVDKLEKFRIKGNSYAIKPGTRHVKVVHKGNILYEKNVVIGNQETKQITLP